MKQLYRRGTKFGDCTLTSFLGGGGKKTFFEKLLDKSNRKQLNRRSQDKDTDLWDD